jgi:Ca2+:H+ antiporter
MAHNGHARLPAWTWIAPVLAGLLIGLTSGGVAAGEAVATEIAAGILLAGAVFAAVHHAEVLALRLGEPFGSILLAVSVTVIEVGLIISIMLTAGAAGETVARDTVFAAVMIVLNGIVGLCLVLGAGRHREQSFQLEGATAALAVLGALAVLALVLPSFTHTTPGPYYSRPQLLLDGVVSLALYSIFVFVQTVRHREYFLDAGGDPAHGPEFQPSGGIALLSAALLILALVSVVLLAKLLSHPLEAAVDAAGLPRTVVGVVIAAVVLLPEGLASVRAALANRLQNSLNLALGSAIASIGLTIPAVAAVSLIGGQRLALGLTPENIVLLMLTLFMGTLTLGTGRTTVLQGAVHLVIFAVFLMMAASP